MHTVPSRFQFLFPSSLVDELDFARDKTYIIETLLKNASLEAWQWLFDQYSPTEIATVLMQARNLKKKDVMIWSNYFNIPESKILCLQTKFRSGLKSSWDY